MATEWPGILAPGLRCVFVGFNPSPRSRAAGHRYAHPSNRFWTLLWQAGLTAVRHRPSEDVDLPAQGYGFTDVVPRTTAAAAELTPEELRAGGLRVRAEITAYRPFCAAYTGKGVYRAVAGPPTDRCDYGAQAVSLVAGVLDFVLPSPSGRTGLPADERLRWYRALAAALPPPPRGPAGAHGA